MDGVKVTDNLPEFKSQLQAFDLKLQRSIVANALRAAAQVFKAAIKARTPVLKETNRGKPSAVPGLLRRSIYLKKMPAQKGTARYIVSFRRTGKQSAYYGRFLESGWVPRGPGKRLLGSEKSRRKQRATGRKVIYPFVAPGAQAAYPAALQAFNAKMQQGLDAATRAGTTGGAP